MNALHPRHFFRRCRQPAVGLVHNGRVKYEDTRPSADASTDANLQGYMHAMAQYHAGGPSSAALRAPAERALAALYDCCVVRVHALVRRFVHDDAVAQEVTEDVFYQAWVQAQRFESARGAVMAWLLTMARSRALDAWRKHAAQVVSFDGDAADDMLAQVSDTHTPLDLLTAMDAQHHLHQALEQISPTARQMLSLAFFQGLTHAEISQHLELPLGTVKTTVRRALLRLRELLQDIAPSTELLALQTHDDRS
jgi:RNA polymerase sigma factor (sigma-70 family)